MSLFQMSLLSVLMQLCGAAVCDLYFGLTGLLFGRFCDLVNSITEEAWKGPEEGDCDADALEVSRLVTGFSLSSSKILKV